ncbi:MAG: glycosyltransferase family 39 protein [Solirubrobacteraceae bacterium]
MSIVLASSPTAASAAPSRSTEAGEHGGRWFTDPRFLMFVIVVGAVILRAETIGSHLSDAEGYSYLVGSASSAGGFLHRLAAYENTPPLFYLLLTPLPLTDGAAWLRLPAAIPGALIALLLYLALRRDLGWRAAALAAALVAVAPYLVSYSDYSRGFMLAGAGLTLCLWAALRLLGSASRRWWLLYLLGGAIAMYSEYYAGIFLVALTISMLLFGRRRAVETIGFGLLPLLTLLPWIGQIDRAQQATGHTKLSPVFPGPSPASLRDLTVRLVFGEHGGASGGAGRWLQFLVVAAVIIGAGWILWRGRNLVGSERAGRAIGLIATTGLLVLIGHAIAPAAGLDLFNERYLTMLVPLAAAVLAAALTVLDRRWLWWASAVVLALVAGAVFAQRFHRQYEPDPAPARAVAQTLHPREVLTNSAVVVYYLRALKPVLDRPFGLGPGKQARCRGRCLVVDDSRVPGGVRPGKGPLRTVGPFGIRLVVPGAGS